MRPKEPELDRFGFPLPHSFDFDRPASEGVAPKGSVAGKIRFVLRMAVVAAIVAALWHHYDVGTKIRSGIGRHYIEKARRLHFRNDFPGALVEADRAVRWNPLDPELVLVRGELRRLNKDYHGCLADAEETIRLLPEADRDLEQDDLLDHADRLRRQMFHMLHDHRKAVAAATEALAKGHGERAVLLNDRAYARAVGEFELDEALIDIDEAIKLLKQDNYSFIDTRAYILFRRKQYDEALKEMDRAIPLAETAYAAAAARSAFRNLQSLQESLAVMYHHRGEIYEKQNKPKEAKRDFEAAARFGFDPEAGVY